MNTGRYKSMVNSDSTSRTPGYRKAYLSTLEDFTTMAEPDKSTTVLGDAYRIVTPHAFAVGKAPFELLVDQKTLEVTGESAGAAGSLIMSYSPKIFITGDGPKVLEIINNLLNERLILFVQEDCGDTKYIQFGCDCNWAEINKASFASGTMKGSNAKGYEMTLDVQCKYFYENEITKR